MFVPPVLAEGRAEVLWDLMARHPLGTLVVSPSGEVDADHLPLELDRRRKLLRGHVSRANPLSRLPGGTDVLVIFRGPDHYISPGWQPGRATHGCVAPSWNYAVVHAYGVLRLVEQEGWLRRHLAALAAREEAGRPDPWTMHSAPADFIAALMKNIVGVEITITRLIGKSQACQQYSETNRQGVVAGLGAEGTSAALAMAEVIRAASPAGPQAADCGAPPVGGPAAG